MNIVSPIMIQLNCLKKRNKEIIIRPLKKLKLLKQEPKIKSMKKMIKRL